MSNRSETSEKVAGAAPRPSQKKTRRSRWLILLARSKLRALDDVERQQSSVLGLCNPLGRPLFEALDGDLKLPKHCKRIRRQHRESSSVRMTHRRRNPVRQRPACPCVVSPKRRSESKKHEGLLESILSHHHQLGDILCSGRRPKSRIIKGT